MSWLSSSRRHGSLGVRYSVGVSNRVLAVVLAVLAVAFVVLNFTIEGAGTIFLILAVAAGFGAFYYFRRP